MTDVLDVILYGSPALVILVAGLFIIYKIEEYLG